MTSWASTPSRSSSARITRRIWSSTSPPMASRVCLSASSSSWKCRCMGFGFPLPLLLGGGTLAGFPPSPPSPEPAGDVVFGSLVARIGEQLARHPELHHLTHQEEAGRLRHAGGLLHVVGDDDDGERPPQLENELLDAGGGDRVQGRARLVHQQHGRVDGQRAGDIEALLLTARQAGAA